MQCIRTDQYYSRQYVLEGDYIQCTYSLYSYYLHHALCTTAIMER